MTIGTEIVGYWTIQYIAFQPNYRFIGLERENDPPYLRFHVSFKWLGLIFLNKTLRTWYGRRINEAYQAPHIVSVGYHQSNRDVARQICHPCI